MGIFRGRALCIPCSASRCLDQKARFQKARQPQATLPQRSTTKEPKHQPTDDRQTNQRINKASPPAIPCSGRDRHLLSQQLELLRLLPGGSGAIVPKSGHEGSPKDKGNPCEEEKGAGEGGVTGLAPSRGWEGSKRRNQGEKQRWGRLEQMQSRLIQRKKTR